MILFPALYGTSTPIFVPDGPPAPGVVYDVYLGAGTSQPVYLGAGTSQPVKLGGAS